MSTEMRQSTCLGLSGSGFHHLHYTEWGEQDNPEVIFCLHGLTRNGRDFDYLARRLASRFRVICPDAVGRGLSDWLNDKSAYQYPQYLADMAVLIARSSASKIDIIGTSMGGLIGMMLASMPKNPVRRLILNDIGAFIPRAGLLRIGEYVGRETTFADLDKVERYLREVSAGFGPLDDEQWQHLAVHGTRRVNPDETDSSYVLLYDPQIRQAFDGDIDDVDLWPVWSMVHQDVLILRGADSDILSHDVATSMLERNARTDLVEFQGIGHAPMLMEDGQINTIDEWLG
ncbi:MAG: alpha/beta hydrolase [marine bacterium B5-7]|nr:MAG: alpha/beta hydrolase [marine bacterium B5-7]